MTMQSIDSMEKSADLIIRKKTIPEGRSLDSEPNQSKIYFFASSSAAMRGLKKYDMSISQTPKRVNLSYGRNNFLQVRNGDVIQVF